MKRNVVIGLLGPKLDGGNRPNRWNRWRPTVALCMRENLRVDRFELLYQEKYAKLLRRVADDIREVSPETELAVHAIDLENPWDFEEVFGVLHDFASACQFDPDQEDYLVHITTGTHVEQICLFLRTGSRYFPARLIQTGPPRERQARPRWNPRHP